MSLLSKNRETEVDLILLQSQLEKLEKDYNELDVKLDAKLEYIKVLERAISELQNRVEELKIDILQSEERVDEQAEIIYLLRQGSESWESWFVNYLDIKKDLYIDTPTMMCITVKDVGKLL